ncbi:DUF5777 family beta-barrel protein [Neolewinella antarctica]|uniref:DUF5777 domain-containing protein n=1 Tax=Neolewinella antarctica TaxID=442734 RepID=A0ABX0XD15_9BACT|nr:DUF5777 family beta-barrel protein [Neolewinella antarctica]NJC27188.1 hypothetical protein [Neolewinella antarctica]
MKLNLTLLCFLLTLTGLSAQRERVSRGFKDTRAVNVHSVETLPRGKLDVRISHRFGDLFGDGGGWQTFYGLENAEDVAIGAEYGITNRLTAGLYRAKGGGVTPSGQTGLRRNLNAVVKVRVLHQEETGNPVSVALVGNATFSTEQKIEGNGNLIQSFPRFNHRLAFNGSVVVARKFGEKLSLQLVPGVTHRNLVPFAGENTLVSLGGAVRYQLTRVLAVLADATVPFSSTITAKNGYAIPVGLGLEWDTGGHVFQLNFTNATGIFETDYIPYTSDSWADGEFRMGFTISRWFNL